MEEKSRDSETDHISETVGWFEFGDLPEAEPPFMADMQTILGADPASLVPACSAFPSVGAMGIPQLVQKAEAVGLAAPHSGHLASMVFAHRSVVLLHHVKRDPTLPQFLVHVTSRV